MRASPPHQVRNDDHDLVELTLGCLTAVGYFEEWTAAIKSGDKEKVAEQLQVPRDLLQKAKARGEELAKRLEPVVAGLADRLLVDEPQSIRGANKLLTGLIQWAQETAEKDQTLRLADEWFKYRSSDAVTPVSGDVRSSFISAHNTFIQQLLDEMNIISGAMTTYYFLGQMDDTDDPEAIRTARKLAVNFYGKVGERTGNTALEKTEQYFNEFLQNFKAGSSHP